MMGEMPTKRRPRGTVACQRCKSRKQRCDNEFPSCSNCLSAGEDCSYGLKQVYPAEYVRSLEHHVAELERAVVSDGPTPESVAGPHPNTRNPRKRPLQKDDETDARFLGCEDVAAEDTEPNLELGAGIVALSSNSFLGTSSGFPLAKLLRSAINTSGDPSQIGHSVSQGIITLAPHSTTTTTHKTSRQTEAQSPHGKAEMPSEEVGEKLIDAYYSRVHPKHPFLSRKRVVALHRARKTLVPAHKISPSENRVGRCDYAILHLVYAIGARYLQLTNDDYYPSPSEHYMSALADADAIFAVRSLESLEAMLLLTIYQLRSPTGPGVWWMVGTAMRHCLDCGLHRRVNNASALLDQRRKRIFWTAYMLERSVARTMGRPYSASDRDIDVELPANIDDAIDTEDGVVAAIAESLENPAQITPLTAAIHIFRLQQIESKITHTVCRVDKPVASIKPHKITRLQNALEEWKANIPNTQDYRVEKWHPYLTTDYHMTQYHKALVLLFLPFLPSLTPGHPDLRQIAYSAGQICQLSKRLHDEQTYISFSLLALHANFVAGLVLVYCFCVDSSIFDPRFSSNIRACSTMLYIISERWPQAVKVRTAFDRLVTATVEGQHNTQTQGMQPMTLGVSSQPEPEHYLAHEAGPSLRNSGNGSVWDTFETILGDYQISTDTWMQGSIFDAMDNIPTSDWTTF